MTIAKPDGPACFWETDRGIKGFLRARAGAEQRVAESLVSRSGALPGRGGITAPAKSTLIKVTHRKHATATAAATTSRANRSRPRDARPRLRTAGVAKPSTRSSACSAWFPAPGRSEENMFMGRLPSRTGMVRSADLHSRWPAAESSTGSALGATVSPNTIVEHLAPPRLSSSSRSPRFPDCGLGEGHRLRRNRPRRSPKRSPTSCLRADPGAFPRGGGSPCCTSPTGLEGDVRNRRLGDCSAGMEDCPRAGPMSDSDYDEKTN